jgi:signal transduction histidine kinase
MSTETTLVEKTTVLVVEDDIHLLSGIHDILELSDYHVLTATNGREGLKVLQQYRDNPPDIIVSDIMMPHLDGFGFLEEVRKQDQWVTIPFIFLTAKGEKHDQRRGSLLGADVYIVKPFEPEDLIVAIQSRLKRHGQINRIHEGKESELKRKILTILNHEFRTPLTLVVAYADMLKDFDPASMSDNDIITFLQGINSGADRLRRLIENFITLVELDSGDAEKTLGWRRRKVEDLNAVIQEAWLQIAQPDLRPRHFACHVPDDLPMLTFDVQYITIVIRELLDNAAKFSKDHSTITLNTQAVNDWLEITIQDNGRGIQTDELDKIWLPFYQIKREEFEDQGAGSGLALVDGLVRIHGGTREVISTPGAGSTFIVRLPLVAVATEKPLAAYSNH